MKVVFKPAKAFGTVNERGIHQLIESERDIINAFDNACSKGFEEIYFYVQDLSLKMHAYAMLATVQDAA